VGQNPELDSAEAYSNDDGQIAKGEVREIIVDKLVHEFIK